MISMLSVASLKEGNVSLLEYLQSTTLLAKEDLNPVTDYRQLKLGLRDDLYKKLPSEHIASLIAEKL